MRLDNRNGLNHLALSPRQIRVIHMYGEGMTYAEIGFKLGIARETVKNHAVAACIRNGVINSAQMAVVLAREESGNGASRPGNLKVTFQQRRILLLLSTGRRAKEVQERLVIKNHTYHTHIQNILQNTESKTVEQAVYKATAARLLG